MSDSMDLEAVLALGDSEQANLPSWLSSEQKLLIRMACYLGWTVHRDGQNVGLRSYSGAKIIHFAVRSRSGGTPVRKLKRDVVRHAHPQIKKFLRDQDEGDMDAIVKHMRSVAEATVVHEPEPPKERFVPEARTETVGTTTVPATIISESPMVASAGKGDAYESPTTNVRIWTDGHRDYTCRWPGCDFVSDNRLGPKNHWASHKEKSATPVEQGKFKQDVPEAYHYRPRQTRIEALAAVLKECCDEGEPDWEEVALRALEWQHEQSNQGSELAGEREPMTAEEIVARIRSLLDNGEYGRVISENERLTEQIIELTALVDQSRAETTRIREQFHALSDMMREMVEGEQKGA